LYEGQLRVTCTGRHVHNQVVEFTPLDLLEELFENAGNEWSAHDGGLFVVEQKTQAHQLDAVCLERDDLFLAAFASDRRPPLFAKHERDVGTVHIGIEQSNPFAVSRKCGGEVGRHGGFADATLPRADCNHVLNVFHQRVVGRRRRHAVRCGTFMLLWLRCRQFHVDFDARHAFNRLGGRAYFTHQRTGIVLVEQELNVNLGVFVDVNFLNLLIIDDALSGARMHDLLQRGTDTGEKSLAIY
jgi:hypothetical protein